MTVPSDVRELKSNKIIVGLPATTLVQGFKSIFFDKFHNQLRTKIKFQNTKKLPLHFFKKGENN
jgi:hypothetical protein